MAKGHQAVIRRSLNLPEWIRYRLAELEHWGTLSTADVGGWQMRPAVYHDPETYEFPEPWSAIKPGELWGAPDGTFFFRGTITVPREMAGQSVWLELQTPTEMLARVGGRIAGAFDPNRSLVRLLKRARGGEKIAVELEAYVRSAPDDNRTGQRLGEGHGCTHYWHNARLVTFWAPWRTFADDVAVAQDVAGSSLADQDVRAHVEHHLHEALKLLDRDTADRRVFERSLRVASEYLHKHVYRAPGLCGNGALALIGHSHLDVAYHWRVRQGIRKNARTTAVQLDLMDEFPELRYCHTQPYLYETLKRYYPELHSRLKRKVRSGQWELVGGLYVEPDCNVPSGESLIRQCLLGKRFFLDEFGVDVDTCWLPDVFGNSWIMPQILAGSGIRYFVSNKMSTWNDTNAFPHTSFIWRGLDGSTVDACVPGTHFIGWMAADQLLGNWESFKEKATLGESLYMYGFGDGGGGVTREMLQTARRIRKFPGLPRTRITTAKEYLDSLFARDRKSLSVWDDELYLEMHRGSHTTKGLLKRLNRRCELRARQAEMFHCFARRLGAPKADEALTMAWKQILVNQFHDILPGSHTPPVGAEAAAAYREALLATWGVLSDAMETIAAHARTDVQEGKPVLVFNSLNWSHAGPVELPLDDVPPADAYEVVDSLGRTAPCQLAADGGQGLLVHASAPSVGFATYFIRPASAPIASGSHGLKVTTRALENRFLRMRLDARGEIVSLFDKRLGREVIAPGKRGNVLTLFEDKPGLYDAWDIVRYYKDKSWDLGPASLEVVERGPVRAKVRMTRRFFGSTLSQDICIYADVPRVDFVTRVDWRERHKLLKVAFEVDVLARQATYDLSYGSIARNTGANTSWDEARFEVCAHQWMDLSEADFGVSILNDCKYGCDVRGNVMRLSLLRGTERPDPQSDQGPHEFTYSIWPHAGDWRQGRVFEAGHELNSPMLALPATPHAGKLGAEHSFITVSGHGAMIGAVKPAYDGKGVVLRVVEQYGGTRRVTVQGDLPLGRVRECDLIERPGRPVKTSAGQLNLTLRPFQIRTFVVT
jgi:alpha-mannosidase